MSTVNLETGGPYFLRRHTDKLLPAAVNAVQSHMRETIPATIVRFTHASGFASAVVESIGERPTLWHTARNWQHQRTVAREATGMTLPSHTGTVLVLLHTPAVRDRDQLWPTLVHELVHAVQMGRPGIAEQVLEAHRHDLGLGRQSRRWLADYDRLVLGHEDEACRVEKILA